MAESVLHEFVYGMIFHDRADSWVDISFTRTTDPDGVPIRLGNWTVDPGETNILSAEPIRRRWAKVDRHTTAY